jgi:central glycolytic genes regulator
MDLLKIQKKIVPEILDVLELRYDILKSIYHNQPIGRRSLAQNLNIKERTIRTQINILKELELLNIESMGMYITEEGKDTIGNLSGVIHELKGISELENDLKEVLGLKAVVIVPGNIVEKDMSLDDMGKVSSMYLKKLIKDDFIIGITGGSTMASLAENMIKGKVAKNLLVIPARGGLGKDVETQANNIAAKLAKKLYGSYKLLHIPDNMDKATLDAVLNLPNISEATSLIKKMDLLVFGIGRAETMAYRRNLSKDKVDELIKKGAVAEAFGHYFDINGNEVWEYKTVGLSLERFKSLDKVIAVAGEEEKAEAIMAIAKLKPEMTLITDELAARKILEITN